MLYRSLTVPNAPSPNQPQVLFLSLDKPSFFLDEYIQGKVQVNTGTQLILNDISLSINLSENWLHKEEETYSIGDVYNECLFKMNLDIRKILNINTELICLHPNKYTFPFFFKIPKVVPPCFEYPTIKTKAHVRYTLNAQIVSPYTSGSSSTYVLIKTRPTFTPQNKQFLYTQKTNVRKWGLFSGGKTIMEMS